MKSSKALNFLLRDGWLLCFQPQIMKTAPTEVRMNSRFCLSQVLNHVFHLFIGAVMIVDRNLAYDFIILEWQNNLYVHSWRQFNKVIFFTFWVLPSQRKLSKLGKKLSLRFSFKPLRFKNVLKLFSRCLLLRLKTFRLKVARKAGITLRCNESWRRNLWVQIKFNKAEMKCCWAANVCCRLSVAIEEKNCLGYFFSSFFINAFIPCLNTNKLQKSLSSQILFHESEVCLFFSRSIVYEKCLFYATRNAVPLSLIVSHYLFLFFDKCFLALNRRQSSGGRAEMTGQR